MLRRQRDHRLTAGLRRGRELLGGAAGRDHGAHPGDGHADQPGASGAPAIGDAQLARLEEVVGRMRATSDPIEYVGLNHEFHRAIYSAADRPRRFELIESLQDAFEAYIQYDAPTRPDPQYFEQAHRRHEAIAAALQARRPDRARAPMQEHLEQSVVHYPETVAESQAGDAAAA
jgi:DNA-binding GntR family transcriptional regulator